MAPTRFGSRSSPFVDSPLSRIESLWLTTAPSTGHASSSGDCVGSNCIGGGVGRHTVSHGATLDWLMRRVTTKYVLTLDSDVAFLQPGWLGELRHALDRSGAAAVGEFEAGVGGYRPRLSPALCLLETERIHALRFSFRSFVRFHDPEEALRWRTSGERGENISYEYLASFTSGAFYSDRCQALRTNAGIWHTLGEHTDRDPTQIPPHRAHVMGRRRHISPRAAFGEVGVHSRRIGAPLLVIAPPSVLEWVTATATSGSRSASTRT